MDGKDVQIRDSSITSDRPNQARSPEYIKSEILAPRIQWAGKLVVIITPDTKNHDWVAWEIEYANKLPSDKLIIGVWAHGLAGCEEPEPLKRYADAMVPWDPAKVLAAFNGERIFENAQGVPRPAQSIKRIGC